jgi:hypothetical protein
MRKLLDDDAVVRRTGARPIDIGPVEECPGLITGAL